MYMHEGYHGCCTGMCMLSLQKTTDMELSSHQNCDWLHVHLQLTIETP